MLHISHTDDNNDVVSYRQFWNERVVSRDITPKGRHPTKSFVGGAESIAEYGDKLVKSIDRGANLNTDDHRLYASNFVNNQWRVSRAIHSGRGWVNPETKKYPAALKAHDNINESYNNQIKLLRRLHRGMGRLNDDKEWQRQQWLSFIDWKNNFTNETPKDICVVFLQHLALILNDEMKSLLLENNWE